MAGSSVGWNLAKALNGGKSIYHPYWPSRLKMGTRPQRTSWTTGSPATVPNVIRIQNQTSTRTQKHCRRLLVTFILSGYRRYRPGRNIPINFVERIYNIVSTEKTPNTDDIDKLKIAGIPTKTTKNDLLLEQSNDMLCQEYRTKLGDVESSYLIDGHGNLSRRSRLDGQYDTLFRRYYTP